MAILVEYDAGKEPYGDWLVRNGSRGRIISNHRKKARAVERAKREARKRDTQVRIQHTDGTWKNGPTYGRG